MNIIIWLPLFIYSFFRPEQGNTSRVEYQNTVQVEYSDMDYK